MARSKETEDQILERLLKDVPDAASQGDVFARSPALDDLEAEAAKPPVEVEAPEEHSPDQESEEKPEEGIVDEETGDKEVSPELESALQALRLAGFATEDLEGMSDERVLALGAKQAKVQRDQQEYVRKLTADLKAAQESATKSQVDSTESAELAEETTAQLKALMKPLAEDLGWEDSHADALTKLVSKVTQDATKPLLAKLAEADAKLERANTAAHQALFDNARRQLGERIPRLRDDSVFKSKVEPKLAQLIAVAQNDPASYSSIEDILLDAARLAGLRIYKNKEDAESHAKEVSKAKANGHPVTAPSRKVDPASMTDDERQTAHLHFLMDGGSKEEARRRFSLRR